MSRELSAAAVLLVALMACACGGSSQPMTSSPPSHAPITTPLSLRDPQGSVVLYVTNQSLELGCVDIAVEIDGRPVLNRLFQVGSQHTYVPFRLSMARGRHVLTARSLTGRARLGRSFRVGDRGWLFVAYWYYTKAQGTPLAPQFVFRTLRGPWRSV